MTLLLVAATLFANTSMGPLVIRGHVPQELCGFEGPGDITPTGQPQITFKAKIICEGSVRETPADRPDLHRRRK